jgi:hypothetical protein
MYIYFSLISLMMGVLIGCLYMKKNLIIKITPVYNFLIFKK